MKRSFSQRERALLGIAITLYEKLGKTTQKNIEKLALQCMLLDVALGNIEAIRAKLGTTGDEIEFTDDLRVTARDAIELTYQRAEKVKEDQQELLIPVETTEEYEYELRALRRAFANQPDLLDFVDATVSVDGGPPVPLGSAEAEKQMRKMIRKTFHKGEQPGSSPPA
jgi:hypothetical protein